MKITKLGGIALVVVMSLTLTLPVFAEEEEIDTNNNKGGLISFLWPRVQPQLYQYGNFVGFLGNQNAKGSLFLGRKSVKYPRNNYGVAFNGKPFLRYDVELKDTKPVVYHAYEIPKTLKGLYYVRGCFESSYGLSCGPEFLINVK